MRRFRVLYDFEAQDKVELSVKRGEVVIAIDDDVHDGWIKVDVLNDGRRRGFVPLNYLRETGHPPEQGRSVSLPSPATAAGLATEDSMPRQPSAIPRESAQSFASAALEYGETLHNLYSGGARENSTVSRRSRSEEVVVQRDKQLSQAVPHLRSPPDIEKQKAESHPLSSVDPVVGCSLLTDPNAVVEAFMKNELHFKQLMRQRKDALLQMHSTLERAMADVGMCKEKNAVLARKLRELDQSVDNERKRWKERVEEEKAYISRSMSHEKPDSLARRSPSAYNRC